MGTGSSRDAAPQKAVTISEGDVKKELVLSFSKQVIDFNLTENGCPVNQPVFDEVEITNTSMKKIKFKFDPVPQTNCTLEFSPASGALDKKHSKKVKVKLILKERVNLNFKVTIRIQGGDSMFINLRAVGESGVFGVDPMSLEQVDDNGYRVPKILVDLKTKMLNAGGVRVEGIFRLAGEQTEIKRIKELLNQKKTDIQTNDINAIATLIKIWFRELPVPVLNALPQEVIMGFQDPDDCVSAYNSLPEPNRTLLDWLLDFMKTIVANSDQNKMTAQNISIVVAPNLYDINSPNPLEGLFLSQKCAAFLNHILTYSLAGQLHHN
eukprot:TRINITY_DN17335_c0_g1_i1.p1 TRINITY_DN17335_c0_g1~~TRINITY_DN17335_c0_g1_i1.p1  ORF type:complete len:323 (+),score=57.91 TRINITY_DN17335_c0_g1_i1:58-1026(+)